MMKKVARWTSAVAAVAFLVAPLDGAAAATPPAFAFVALAPTPSGAWAVAFPQQGTKQVLMQFNGATGAITHKIDVPNSLKNSFTRGIAITGHTLATLTESQTWSSAGTVFRGSVSLMNVSTGRLEHTIACGGVLMACGGLVAAQGTVFYVDSPEGSTSTTSVVHEISARTGTQLGTHTVTTPAQSNVAATSSARDVAFVFANSSSRSRLVEISGTTRSVVRNTVMGFKGIPENVAMGQSEVWLPIVRTHTGIYAYSVTPQVAAISGALGEFSITSGALVRALTGAAYHFPSSLSGPIAWGTSMHLVATKSALWVDDGSTTTLTEIGQSSGSVVRVVSLGAQVLRSQGGVLASEGGYLYVGTIGGMEIFNAVTGAKLHTVR